MNKTVSILSWNIHDLMDQTLGAKSTQKEFCDTINKGVLFCLQETKADVHMPNYMCFNKTRPTSRSGGLTIGVHRSVSDHVKEIPSDYEDIMAISISSSLTGFTKDIVLINVYDSPPQSSYKAKQRASGNDIDTIDQLTDFIAGLENKSIFLAGDFNARTGRLNSGRITHDISQNFGAHLQESYPSSLTMRASKDTTLNERGRKLLEFMESCNLTILNGSTVGDIFGEFTSLQYNGASVVDYMAVSPNLIDVVDSVKVFPLTPFSDHSPLLCSLKHSCSILDDFSLSQRYDEAPQKLKWDPETSGGMFKVKQDTQEYREIIKSILQKECQSAEDVIRLNEKLSRVLKNTGEKCGKERKITNKAKRKTIHPKNKWFDISCILKKRELNILSKRYGKHPTDAGIRDNFYRKKKEYKSHIKRKKYLYFKEINEDILQDGNISWSDFKRLKSATQEESKLDFFDIENFFRFFKELYKKRVITKDLTLGTQANAEPPNMLLLLQDILNKDVHMEELMKCVKGLKNGKAAGEDGVINEFLKNCGESTLEAIGKLFNECLRFGVYPWNTTIITPLHKKGCPHDPDNYRAIAVGSNLGKLFSTILLNRLLEFRSKHCPDTPNQRGFCKGAQTADHIFSLSTCTEKYVRRQRKRLYTCFVDFRKAFDATQSPEKRFYTHSLD